MPQSDMVVPFSMLLNLQRQMQMTGWKLWGFIRRYAPDASPEANPQLDQAAGFAVRYYNDFVKPNWTYRMPTDLA